MLTLICSKCGENKGYVLGYYRCTNPECRKPLCIDCAAVLGLTESEIAAVKGGIKEEDIHPLMSCPHCNSPVKFIK